MGNLESTEGGPGEPPSVPLLLPPGKTPMPEPCELEERFALVLVRPARLAACPPPPKAPAGSRPRPPPARSTPDPASHAGSRAGGSPGAARRGSGRRGPQAPDLPAVQTPPHFPQTSRSAAGIPSLAGRLISEAVGSPAQVRLFLPRERGFSRPD